MIRARATSCISLAVFITVGLSGEVLAFEGDVHYGLTNWLALKARFTQSQAVDIAEGNFRVDGGSIETSEMVFEYACAGRFPEVAQQAQEAHYPAQTRPPASAESRTVVPGGPAARKTLEEALASANGQQAVYLRKFGAALHPLQDSWAHQGRPEVPSTPLHVSCDPLLSLGHASARGGPSAHLADVTFRWVDDTIQMAKATYAALASYPSIQGRARTPVPWASLVADVDAFARANTKVQKLDWFKQRGISEVAFLAGISIPDGGKLTPLTWPLGRMPALTRDTSLQYDVPEDIRAFFDALFARWLRQERVEAILADMGPIVRGKPTSTVVLQSKDLALRMKLWMLRDHGAAASILHGDWPLHARERQAALSMASGGDQHIEPTTPAAGMFALQPAAPAPVPLLPYIVLPLKGIDGTTRMLALARFRHAPYDTVGAIAERLGDRWVLADVISAVDY